MTTFAPDAQSGLNVPADDIRMVVLILIGLFFLFSWIAVLLSVLRIEKHLKQLVALLGERLPEGKEETPDQPGPSVPSENSNSSA